MSEREGYLATLQDMGFGPNRATRALKATGYKVIFSVSDPDPVRSGIVCRIRNLNFGSGLE